MDYKRCIACNRRLPAGSFVDATGQVYKTCNQCLERKRERRKNWASTKQADNEANRNRKRCTRCGQMLPLSDFLPNFDVCRNCQKARRERMIKELG